MIDLVEGDDDSIYIEVLESRDRLIICGDEVKGNVFLEIDTAKGGVIDQTMEVSKFKILLIKLSKELALCIENPEIFGFEVSPF